MGHKILFISSWYPNPKDRTHGVFVKRYAEAVALYNEVAVIHVFGDESFSETLRIESRVDQKVFEVFVYFKKKKKNPLSKYLHYRKMYLLGLNYLKKEWGKPHLLQVNVVFPVAIAALPLINNLKVPYLISEHWTGYHPEDGSYHGVIKKILTHKLVAGAQIIHVVTSHLKKSMEQHGLMGNYRVIPNTVDSRIFHFKQKEKSAKVFRFLHVSSLEPRQKNVEGIIDAFKMFQSQNPSSELVICGDGDNRKSLEFRCGELLNSQIFFKGNCYGNELASEFYKAECFILFSNYENLPVVLLESLCCGLPVITTSVGGIREFISDRDGILIEPWRISGLLSAMEMMYKEIDKFDRIAIAKNAKEEYGYEGIGKRFTSIYNKIISS
jgi:L-malate glycosyltransferase